MVVFSLSYFRVNLDIHQLPPLCVQIAVRSIQFRSQTQARWNKVNGIIPKASTKPLRTQEIAETMTIIGTLYDNDLKCTEPSIELIQCFHYDVWASLNHPNPNPQRERVECIHTCTWMEASWHTISFQYMCVSRWHWSDLYACAWLQHARELNPHAWLTHGCMSPWIRFVLMSQAASQSTTLR